LNKPNSQTLWKSQQLKSRGSNKKLPDSDLEAAKKIFGPNRFFFWSKAILSHCPDLDNNSELSWLLFGFNQKLNPARNEILCCISSSEYGLIQLIPLQRGLSRIISYVNQNLFQSPSAIVLYSGWEGDWARMERIFPLQVMCRFNPTLFLSFLLVIGITEHAINPAQTLTNPAGFSVTEHALTNFPVVPNPTKEDLRHTGERKHTQAKRRHRPNPIAPSLPVSNNFVGNRRVEGDRAVFDSLDLTSPPGTSLPLELEAIHRRSLPPSTPHSTAPLHIALRHDPDRSRSMSQGTSISVQVLGCFTFT
jgi:hypothetical protein